MEEGQQQGERHTRTRLRAYMHPAKVSVSSFAATPTPQSTPTHALVRVDTSQEEYLDLSSLETRLKHVATAMNERNSSAGNGGAPPPSGPLPASAPPMGSHPTPQQQQQGGLLPSGMVPAPGCAPTPLAHPQGVTPSNPLVLAPPSASGPQAHRSHTPFGAPGEDLPSSLGRHSSSGLPPVSSGLPVEGGVLGAPPPISSSFATTLTPSGAPVLMKRNNVQREGSYGAPSINVRLVNIKTLVFAPGFLLPLSSDLPLLCSPVLAGKHLLPPHQW